MKLIQYDALKGMKLIPTDKTPGCLVHLTRFEMKALYKGLERALHGPPMVDANSSLDDNERDTLVALRTQILRYQKEVGK